jgi:sulfoxide reductase heme-binding subunit YedZ
MALVSPPSNQRLARLLKVIVHGGALLPLCWLVWAIPADRLGGDPVESLIHFLGMGALRLLLLTLCITPLARGLKKPFLHRLRRPLGLWAFVWASLHIASWVVFDLGLEWGLIAAELVKRTYIVVGFSAWLILLTLAVTSIPRLVRVLSGRWKKIHRAIYPAVLLICVHFWWSLKSGWLEPAIYLTLVLGLVLLVPGRWGRYLKLN